MGLLLKIRYIINDGYNAWYIKKMNIADTTQVLLDSFQNNSEAKVNASPFMSVWLLNIKRIITASGVLPQSYDFLDVGCGKAISTIYAKDKYRFKSVSGFDFEVALLEIARKNISQTDKKMEINLFEADASLILLEKKKWFIFMFNPFDAVVLEKFILNNIKMLRETESIIGYANSRELEVIKKFSPTRIVEIPDYRCAVVFF